MSTTTCCACHDQVPADSTFFSAVGEVCGPCHDRDAARDSARLARGADGNVALHDVAHGNEILGGASQGFSLFIGPINVWPMVRFVFRTITGLFRGQRADVG